jgi:hypothetical protein
LGNIGRNAGIHEESRKQLVLEFKHELEGGVLMEYAPLKTINPTDIDLTVNSSIWLAGRIMPGKGNGKISFPHYKVINEAGARTAELSDLNMAGMIGMNDGEELVNLQASAGSLVWRGCWMVNEQAVIGHATAAQGLVAPFNTFNAGYRYKRGWRPSRVN